MVTIPIDQDTQLFFSVDIYSEGLNRLRNSDLVLKKTEAFAKMSVQNLEH